MSNEERIDEDDKDDGERQEPAPERPDPEKGEMWQFLVVLRALLRTVDEPPRRTRHERLPLDDMLFILITKVFFRFSSADHCLFLELLHPDLQPLGRIPHRNSIINCMRMERLRPILEALVCTCSRVLILYTGVLFAIDGTPMLTPGYYESKDKKTGKLYERRNWIRLHMICDVLTGVVTAVRADSNKVSEQKYFKVLIDETINLGFHVEAVAADKYYCTKDNVRWASEERGIETNITLKKNAVRSKKNSDPAWDENYDRAKSVDPDVKVKFHQRAIIESVNAFIKGKYGGELFSKSAAGQYNEALCKVICRNLIVLIRYSRKMGLTPGFEK
jgi:transposase